MLTRHAVRRALLGRFRLAKGDSRGSASGAGVRDAAPAAEGGVPLVLVGLSGGADSLALAAAVAAEAPRLGVRAGAVVVDHGLQSGSADVAQRAAEQARGMGLEPVLVERVIVSDPSVSGEGLEAAARSARYAAFRDVASRLGASVVLTGHTRDDQSEQVLLALARGSGTRSIAGIPFERSLGPDLSVVRPFLTEHPEVTRAVTLAACEELALTPWHDPHNADTVFARVRVREEILPVVARALGERAVKGLARSADLAREDADALDVWAAEVYRRVVEERPADPGRDAQGTFGSGVRGASGAGEQGESGEGVRGTLPRAMVIPVSGVRELLELPAAVRQRVIHRVAQRGFGAQLSRDHTLAVAELITNWRGQGPIFVPGMRVARDQGALLFEAQHSSPRSAHRSKTGPTES